MTHARLWTLVACLVLWAGTTVARDKQLPEPSSFGPPRHGLDAPRHDPLRAGVTIDTTWLGFWDFNDGSLCSDQGWTSVDRTAQPATYFHIDDFAGLGGGDFGRLLPLEGNQSMWCGARPDAANSVICGYETLPGYGNGWQQGLCTTACLATVDTARVDFLATWDTETSYDYFHIQYRDCSDVFWTTAATVDGIGSGLLGASIETPPSGQVELRLFFESDGAWSDEDGLWNTDGAVIVDSLTVTDATGVVLATELFEAESVGDQTTASGNWAACTWPPYGDYAGLFPGLFVLQEDPCESQLDCMWGFFQGSTYNYACGGFPGQPVVPWENERGQYIWNEVWSPLVPLNGAGASMELSFRAYFDLPLDNLVFAVWHVRSWVGGCPGPWRDQNSVYWSTDGWTVRTFEVGSLIDFSASHVQIAVGVADYCPWWCGAFGHPNCHSHAPLYDEVGLIRLDTVGPRWTVAAENLFQDTFAADGTTTGTARADAAVDLEPTYGGVRVIPGDSASFFTFGGDADLAPDPYTGFGAAVYLYAHIDEPGQPGKTGGALSGDPARWPVVDSLTHNGDTWYCLRTDTAFQYPGRVLPVDNRFCVDLNDNLFTPGDTISFVLAAQNGPPESAFSYWSSQVGTTIDLAEALNNPDEFTILPGGGWRRGGDILYIDDFDGYGAQPAFDAAFRYWNIYDLVDRYDVRAPKLYESNGPGGRVVNVSQQITGCYRKIIWNSGDLARRTIGDGETDKSDDAGMLAEFLDQLPNTGGVWISGDGVAQDIENLYGASATALESFIGFNVLDDNHVQYGLPVSPLLTGEPGGMFDHLVDVDTLTANGGCPVINHFDVLTPQGTATQEMRYDGNPSAGAVVAQRTTNTAGFEVGVVLSGFSYHYVANPPAYTIGEPPPKYEHMGDILNWLGNFVVGGATDVPAANALGQNYPNPFNPATTIRYTIVEPGPVRLGIYDVAGRLVRTLLNERARAGSSSVVWDGRNDTGQRVSSGVYFYRLQAPSFTATRKMVLLK